MNKKLQWILGVILVLIIIWLVAASVNKSHSDTIKIGWMGPQTGPSAVLGMDSFVAAQIAVDKINANGGINGKKAVLYVEDDQYNTEKSVSAYKKLVNVDGVKIILTNTYSSVFALAKQAEQDGVILIDPLDCNSELAGQSKNVFCLATDSESLARVLAEAANSKGYKKAAILYFNSDLFMPLVQKVFSQTYKGDIVFKEPYQAGTRDFRTEISKIMASGADSLVLLGYDETGNAMKQARDAGFNGQFFTTGTVTSPSLQQAAQGKADGTLLSFWTIDKSAEKAKAFDAAFQKIQKREPILDLATYPSYDAVKVIGYALAKTANDTNEELAQQLLQVKGYDGITGKISFNQDGSMLIPERLFILKDGKVLPQ